LQEVLLSYVPFACPAPSGLSDEMLSGHLVKEAIMCKEVQLKVEMEVMRRRVSAAFERVRG